MRTLPYGSWPSPIDADDVARHDGMPNWPSAIDDEVWWTEPRPAEGGRVTLCRTHLGAPDRRPETVLPAPWNARSRVHEYGGRPFLPVHGEMGGTAVVFSEYSDQRLYFYEPGVTPAPLPITPEPAIGSGLRYVEPVLGPNREVWCVREEHLPADEGDPDGSGADDAEARPVVRRAIVAVPLDGTAAADPGAVRVVAGGHHFLACPRLSEDGRRLSWIGWDHPAMPWDSTVLNVVDLFENDNARAIAVGEPQVVAGGPGEAVVQAEWGTGATLFCISDPDGWWNPHQITVTGVDAPTQRAVALTRREEEFGGPLWQLGQRWMVPLQDDHLVLIHGRATTSLGVLSPDTGEIFDFDTPHTEWFGKLTLADRSERTVVGVAASPTLPAEVVAVDIYEGTWRSLSRPRSADASASSTTAADGPVSGYLPRPEARVFTGAGGREVHANLYPPHNPDYTGVPGELPPYVVWVHGGPTSRAPMLHDLEIAYFTSRGIGVVDVNYGGSTGFGRAYRERLRENWGVVDVEDSVAAAQGLVAEGLADPGRLAIRGGSAGGWTSAAALVFTDAFHCGTIQYPIVDLAGWRTGETHDFESRYLESLVGPWPQVKERYEERSPVNHGDAVSVPFLLLQGLEDEICPPIQSERFLERIRGRGVPHAYLTFEGEQHGFRRESTIRTALQAELSLYARVFGFETDAPALELRS
ncbi:S9 family peptidase [Nocardiopsis mangrovi]|uniref:S9 family peptidase n=1 Tax=Nocardiopsis mangrovi TaxID=1179818 RepID=A0ABV9DUQ0_9ACTN